MTMIPISLDCWTPCPTRANSLISIVKPVDGSRTGFGSIYFGKTSPADTKAWAFLKQLARLEDRDAIEDGADPDEVYARNEFIPAEVVRRLKGSPEFDKAVREAEK